jgi:hypothetical protein
MMANKGNSAAAATAAATATATATAAAAAAAAGNTTTFHVFYYNSEAFMDNIIESKAEW